jgi:hypothetical protein
MKETNSSPMPQDELAVNIIKSYHNLKIKTSARINAIAGHLLMMALYNPADPIEDVRVFVILDVHGYYWLAPSWVPISEGIDSYEVSPFNFGSFQISIISEFAWPGGTGSADHLYFHAAITDSEITKIIGESSSWEFAYH